MIKLRPSSIAVCCALCACCAASAVAADIYRWVDENGVVNFSATAPAGVGAGVDTVVLEDTVPKHYDAGADIYNVAAQAERMRALREQLDTERAARRERERSAARQPPAEQDRPVAHYGYPYAYPVYPRPPARPPNRPRPPVPEPEPYPTSTLRPPGLPQDR